MSRLWSWHIGEKVGRNLKYKNNKGVLSKMYIYLYFTLNTEVAIDKLEEKIKAILDGKGEVIGSGKSIVVETGNIDVKLFDKTILECFLEELQKMDFPQDTVYFIGDVKKRLFENKEVE